MPDFVRGCPWSCCAAPRRRRRRFLWALAWPVIIAGLIIGSDYAAGQQPFHTSGVYNRIERFVNGQPQPAPPGVGRQECEPTYADTGAGCAVRTDDDTEAGSENGYKGMAAPEPDAARQTRRTDRSSDSVSGQPAVEYHPPPPPAAAGGDPYHGRPEMIIADVWAGNGASRLETAQALAVAWHESTWVPTARNNTCCAAGLFQITWSTWRTHQTALGVDYLRENKAENYWCDTRDNHQRCATRVEVDPWYNARMAHYIWSSDLASGYLRRFHGWGQWSVVNEGVENIGAARAGILTDPIRTIRRRDPAAAGRAEAALAYFYG